VHGQLQYLYAGHFAIPPTEAIEEDKSPYIVTMPWNLKNEIFKADSSRTCSGCQLVIPSPPAEVIRSRWSDL